MKRVYASQLSDDEEFSDVEETGNNDTVSHMHGSEVIDEGLEELDDGEIEEHN